VHHRIIAGEKQAGPAHVRRLHRQWDLLQQCLAQSILNDNRPPGQAQPFGITMGDAGTARWSPRPSILPGRGAASNLVNRCAYVSRHRKLGKTSNSKLTNMIEGSNILFQFPCTQVSIAGTSCLARPLPKTGGASVLTGFPLNSVAVIAVSASLRQ